MTVGVLRYGLTASTVLLAHVAMADCWQMAGGRHGIEVELLQAIATVESNQRADAVHINDDGSRDLGMMQINSMHLPRLARAGITADRLLDDPCLSIDVGAEILAGFVARYGYNWTAVGAYNAGVSSKREAARSRYARRVWREYRRLLDQAG